MSKSTLDIVTTVLGVLAGVSTMLANQGVKPEITGAIAGISTAVLGYFVQKPAVEPK